MYSDKSFLSLGGGVQSTALALMVAKNPEVLEKLGYPLPRHIIFADTGAEPQYTLENVENVFRICKAAGLETYTVRDSTTILDLVPESSGGGIATPPYYTRDKFNNVGRLQRQCTGQYKIEPITQKQRELLGYKKGERIPKGVSADIWIGISVEEARRAKPSELRWLIKRYPLIDLRLNRTACGIYAYKILGYKVEKSSCFFCPFRHPEGWISMKENHPEEFERAVEFDERIRNLKDMGKGVKNPCYVHRSAYPLKDVVGKDSQMSLFNQEQEECSGGCFL